MNKRHLLCDLEMTCCTISKGWLHLVIWSILFFFYIAPISIMVREFIGDVVFHILIYSEHSMFKNSHWEGGGAWCINLTYYGGVHEFLESMFLPITRSRKRWSIFVISSWQCFLHPIACKYKVLKKLRQLSHFLKGLIGKKWFPSSATPHGYNRWSTST